MAQKCMYCNSEIHDDREITVCDICGQKVWGEKMFNTIKENMHEAKEKGDLCHSNPFVEHTSELDDTREM